MRGVSFGSPFSVLFLFAITFLLFARRGVHIAASALLAGTFALGATYSLLAFREADRQRMPFATVMHPGRWTKATRKQLQSAVWAVVAAMCVLLSAGVLTNKIVLI